MEDAVKRKTTFHVAEPEKDAALLSGEAAVTCVSFARWQQGEQPVFGLGVVF